MSTKVISLVGLPGAGKTFLAKHFCEKYGFIHVEVSDSVREYYSKNCRPNETYINFVQRTLKSTESADIFAIKTAEKCINLITNLNNIKGVMVTGFRIPIERHSFSKIIPEAQFVYLKCNTDIRRSRKPKIDKCLEMTFSERDFMEISWGVQDLENEAHLIINSEMPIEQCVSTLAAYIL